LDADDPAAPESADAAAGRPCAPCRGTGRVLAQVSGALEPSVCPWCEGSGRFLPDHDAQLATPEARDLGEELRS
jgi:hypothetical protein